MVLPQECILFRMGGDEFLVLLPSTLEEKTQLLVKQLKDKQKQFRIQNRQLSLSFGVAVMNSRADSFHKCITDSDRNMYFEKRKKHK